MNNSALHEKNIWNDGRWQAANRLCHLQELVDQGFMSEKIAARCQGVAATYPFAATPYYLSLMQGRGIDDPVARQALPSPSEYDSAGGSDDPLDEERDTVVPGLIHRYPDRCLAMVTSRCAVYCRHCNRKNRWSGDRRDATREELFRMIEYIRRTPSIREVILSGGDPLVMARGALFRFLTDLAAIPHVAVLRIGTRLPVVMPMGIDHELCDRLRRFRPLWVVTQFNHAAEITGESADACARLLESGIPVLNQSVLLKGVNDSIDAMRALLYGLQRIAVRPYYLFHCEPVRGAMHFRTSVAEGIVMMETLRREISGLCMPRYVIDLPDGAGKMPLYPGCGELNSFDFTGQMK